MSTPFGERTQQPEQVFRADRFPTAEAAGRARCPKHHRDQGAPGLVPTEAPAAPPEELSVDDDGRASSQLGSRGFRSGRPWWPGAICLGLYLILTILEFGPSTSLGAGGIAVEGGSDGASQIWFLEWTQYALAHGHNPFFSQWQSFPTGLNVGVDTSMVALGVIFSPVTSLFGPIVTWNVLLRLAVVLSAFSMCLVLRRWTRWWPAAFFGGLIYGFSAYVTFNLGHLFLVFVPLPPLMFLLLHEILVRQQWRPALNRSDPRCVVRRAVPRLLRDPGHHALDECSRHRVIPRFLLGGPVHEVELHQGQPRVQHRRGRSAPPLSRSLHTLRTTAPSLHSAIAGHLVSAPWRLALSGGARIKSVALSNPP